MDSEAKFSACGALVSLFVLLTAIDISQVADLTVPV